MNNKPIPESYWVLPGHFLAGEYPTLRDDESGSQLRLIAFLNAGFDTFLDLTCEGERMPYITFLKKQTGFDGHEVHHRRFSFLDFHVPSHERMVVVLDEIDSALAEGRKVYLHCVGGIGRTGTTVGCHFIRHGLKPGQALLHLNELYKSAAQSLLAPNSPESIEQINFILGWEEDGLA
jgi:hypothetical protein